MRRHRSHDAGHDSWAPTATPAPGKRMRSAQLAPVQRRPSAAPEACAPAPDGAAPADHRFYPAPAAAHDEPREPVSFVDSLLGAGARDASAGPDRPVQRAAQAGVSDAAPAEVHAAAAAGIGGPAGALPFTDVIQRSFGAHDISAIQAHVGGPATAASAAMGAEAYATGNHVAFARAPDLHTAAHEAAHVVQQRAGVQLQGGVGEVGDVYEQQADAVADTVVRGESAEHLLGAADVGATGSAEPGVQRKGRVAGRRESPLRESIRYLEERASEPLRADGEGKGPREGDVTSRAADVALAARMVTDELGASREPLDAETSAALRHAMRQVHLVQAMGGRAAAFVQRMGRELAAAALARGVDSSAGFAPLAGEADDVGLLERLEGRMGDVVQSLAAFVESNELGAEVSAAATSVSLLLRQVEGVLRGADTRDMERFVPVVARIRARVDVLHRRARSGNMRLDVALVSCFELEERVLTVVGMPSPQRLSTYYDGVRASAEDPTSSAPALIDRIVAQLTSVSTVQQGALSVVAAALQEPEAAPPPTLLASVLQGVVADVIGKLPGLFAKALEKVGKRLATGAGAKAADAAARAAGAAVGAASDAGDERSRSMLASGFFNTAKAIVAKGTGKASKAATGTFDEEDSRARPELKTRFLRESQGRIIAYMTGPLHDRAMELKYGVLVHAHPEALQVIATEMGAGLTIMLDRLVQELLFQWMNLRAELAHGATDEQGRLKGHGTLKDLVEHTGMLSVEAGLPDAPGRLAGGELVVGRVSAAGIGPAVLREIKRGNPLAFTELVVHRVIKLGDAGRFRAYGEVRLTASGEVLIERLSSQGRRRVAAFGQPVAGGSSWGALLRGPDEPSDEAVLAGVQRLIAKVPGSKELLR